MKANLNSAAQTLLKEYMLTIWASGRTYRRIQPQYKLLVCTLHEHVGEFDNWIISFLTLDMIDEYTTEAREQL